MRKKKEKLVVSVSEYWLVKNEFNYYKIFQKPLTINFFTCLNTGFRLEYKVSQMGIWFGALTGLVRNRHEYVVIHKFRIFCAVMISSPTRVGVPLIIY